MKKLVIIGGGINGAGVARDAAMRGWNVTLLEKNDFASGTSWASSKLIHGGLRYLEHGELGLVRESVRERETLMRIYPNNIRPLHFLLAVYRRSPYGLSILRIGMTLYEYLSAQRSLPAHEVYSPEQLRSIEPGLDRQELQGGIAYWDAQCLYPERLVLANLHSAEENGAQLFNYHQVIRLDKQQNQIQSVTATDLITGKKKTFQCDCVVNAAGPWIDDVVTLNKSAARPLIGGTRGSHIVVPRFQNGPQHAIYVNARTDGRPFFILPWLDYFLIGTTDLRHEGSLNELTPANVEIEYLINEANYCFPSANLNLKSILFSFSGIRPLPFSAKKKPGAITRRFIVIDHTKKDGITNLISLVGGKLTTFRRSSQQAVDAVNKKVRANFRLCETDTIPLWGGAITNLESFMTNAFMGARQRNIDEPTFRHLVTLYGTHYQDVLKLAEVCPSGYEKVCSHGTDIIAQILYAVRHEWAKTLTDVMLRRTSIGISSCLGMDACETAANVMGGELGWSEVKIREEITAYKDFVSRRLLSHRH